MFCLFSDFVALYNIILLPQRHEDIGNPANARTKNIGNPAYARTILKTIKVLYSLFFNHSAVNGEHEYSVISLLFIIFLFRRKILPTAYCILHTAHCILPTFNHSLLDYSLLPFLLRCLLWIEI